jgi:hypothetical protein
MQQLSSKKPQIRRLCSKKATNTTSVYPYDPLKNNFINIYQ